MSRFDEPIKMKLGEILKTFTTSTYAMDTDAESAIASACPIWELLNITEEEYHVKYSPPDLSGNALIVDASNVEIITIDTEIEQE